MAARLVVLIAASACSSANAMRVVVFGGSGFIGSAVCKALVEAGCCSVQSISRNGKDTMASTISLTGQQKANLARYDGEAWISEVDWRQEDSMNVPERDKSVQSGVDVYRRPVAAPPTAPKLDAVTLDGAVDVVVSCVGTGELLKPRSDGWLGARWSPAQEQLYAQNYNPNSQAVAAAKAAGAARFVYVGVSSEAELGFGGSLPGLYTAKLDTAILAQETFGEGFTYMGPHLVVPPGDGRLKFGESGLAKNMLKANAFIGGIASMGEDMTRKTQFTPPVDVDDLAKAIAAAVTGKVKIESSERYCGMTTPNGAPGFELTQTLRHVDGTEAIRELARRANC